MMNEQGQSDGGIVPKKSANKPEGAEQMEGRPPTKGNAQKSTSLWTLSRIEEMKKALECIREAVRKQHSGNVITQGKSRMR